MWVANGKRADRHGAMCVSRDMPGARQQLQVQVHGVWGHATRPGRAPSRSLVPAAPDQAVVSLATYDPAVGS